jgi:hypothetical protein
MLLTGLMHVTEEMFRLDTSTARLNREGSSQNALPAPALPAGGKQPYAYTTRASLNS